MSVMKSYFSRITDVSKSIVVGLGITWRYLVRPEEIVTIQYGSKKYAPQTNYLPERHRGVHYLETEKCIHCDICVKACPVDCIEIESTRDGALEGGWQGDKVVISKFIIDLNKCIFCNLCCEPCPKDCIHMGQEFDLSAFDRAHGIKNLLTDRPWTEDDKKAEAERRVAMAELAEQKKREKAAAAAKKKVTADKPE